MITVSVVANQILARDAKGTPTRIDAGEGNVVIEEEGGSLAVRRLTPTECERQRLMGWPDGWTRWTSEGKEIADTTRYQMTGNGICASVAQWIGQRIVSAEAAMR